MWDREKVKKVMSGKVLSHIFWILSSTLPVDNRLFQCRPKVGYSQRLKGTQYMPVNEKLISVYKVSYSSKVMNNTNFVLLTLNAQLDL